MSRLLFVLAAMLTACGVALTSADYARIAADSAAILSCQDVGRACKAADAGACYSKYNACMHDAGFR